MAKTLRRNWRQSKTGTWTCSLGDRGMRVRLFNKRRDGVFYRAVWDRAQQRKSVASLRTCDRAEAERFGRELLAELLKGASIHCSGPVKLGTLWSQFCLNCAAFRDNHPRTRSDAERRVAVLRAFFGEGFDVRTLTADDQRNYANARRAGGIRLSTGRITSPVRQRSVEADLVALQHMLSWATTVALPNGAPWLKRNPLAGIKRDREKNPLRAVATWDRYQQTRAAMRQLAVGANDTERARWTRMELALMLAEATGRRLGSIRALRWEDIDLDKATIRWRAETDKKGIEWVIPIPHELVEEIRQFQHCMKARSGLLFPSATRAEVPMDRHQFDKWLSLAEAHAGLPKLKGALWHAYRRKWASERKNLSLVDVAAAGGWKDTNTLVECYMQPDTATLLQVMSSPSRLREVAFAS